VKLKKLFLPAAGGRAASNGTLSNAGTFGIYFSSTPFGTANAMILHFSSSATLVLDSGFRANGFSVRCVAELNANVLRVNEWTSNWVTSCNS
jgi:hypothetical protein